MRLLTAFGTVLAQLALVRYVVCFLVSILTGGALSGATPEELIRKSLANFQRAHLHSLNYTWMERDRETNGDKVKTSVSQVFVVKGTPYEKTISRNGKPLTTEEERREQEKLEKRRGESPDQQRKRLHEFRNAFEFLQEVPEAFQLSLAGTEVVNGRPAWVIACTPKPGYRAGNKRAAMFAHMKAKIWVDKEDLQWAKADADVTDTIAIGWILARIGPGAKLRLEQTRINSADWMPSMIQVNGDARILLVKNKPIHEHIEFYDYRPTKKGEPTSVTHLKKAQ